jgi:hypothetical protein
MTTPRCEGLVDDEPCQEAGTHFLCNRAHGPEGDKLLAALERDCPDDPMLQVQLAGWFCGEHAGHILGHYPMMVELEVR